MHHALKKLYFERALLKAHKKPPGRLPRVLYPETIEEQYATELEEFVKFIKRRVDARIKPLLPGLVLHYGRARADADDEPKKYYTAFVYDKTLNAQVLHCTHHYLGKLDRAQVLDVEKRIDAYFLQTRKLPAVAFNRVDYFGEAKDVRVLRPASYDAADFFPELKASLDSFRKDDYAEYKPHVSHGSAHSVDRPFAGYALISKAGIHRLWGDVKLDAPDDDNPEVSLAALLDVPAPLGDLASELRQVRIEVTGEYTPEEIARLAKLTGTSVADWNARQMNGQLRSILEIDPFGSEPWLAREIGAFVAQNVSLIESIETQYLSQVEQMVATSVRAGIRAEEIAAELEDRYDVAASRADLIARDQIGKFNGQLNEARQTDLGIDEYVWRDSGDARVRPSHHENNGKSFRWDDPPSETGHPGQDYQCRCSAEPVLSKFYEGEEG